MSGYALKPPVTNPNAPDWAKSVIVSQQPVMDKQYMSGSGNSLDHYYAMADAWKVSESQARAISASPETYTPAKFIVPVPVREIYDYYDGVWMGDSRNGLDTRKETDPAILAPTLDPYVRPVVVKPGISVTGAQDQMVAIFALLLKLQSDVNAIKAAMHVA